MAKWVCLTWALVSVPALAAGWTTEGTCDGGYVLAETLSVSDGVLYVAGDLVGTLTLPSPSGPLTMRSRHEVANAWIAAFDVRSGQVRWARSVLADGGIGVSALLADDNGVWVYGSGAGHFLVTDDPDAVRWDRKQEANGPFAVRLAEDGALHRIIGLPGGRLDRVTHVGRLADGATALWGVDGEEVRLELVDPDGGSRCTTSWAAAEARPEGLATGDGVLVTSVFWGGELTAGAQRWTAAASPSWWAASVQPDCEVRWAYVHDGEGATIASDVAQVDGTPRVAVRTGFDEGARILTLQPLDPTTGRPQSPSPVSATFDTIARIVPLGDEVWLTGVTGSGVHSGASVVHAGRGAVVRHEQGWSSLTAGAVGDDLLLAEFTEEPGLCLRVARVEPRALRR